MISIDCTDIDGIKLSKLICILKKKNSELRKQGIKNIRINIEENWDYDYLVSTNIIFKGTKPKKKRT